MMCLLKRVLPFMFGLMVSIALVSLIKIAPNLITVQPALSDEAYQLDVTPIAPPDFTYNELEAMVRHLSVGLCHSHGKSVDVVETIADFQPTTKAKILYLPEPGSWEKQDPCAECLVMLRLTLNASGKVTNIVQMPMSLHEDVGVDRSQCKKDVLAAVNQIRFEPAMRNGRPVSQLVTIIYDKWGREMNVR